MTRVLRRTVPLLLLATLVLSANPVQSGGRDVPESQLPGSGGTTSTAWPAPCGDEPVLVWVGGVPYTVSLNPDGSAQLEPSLVGVWDHLLAETARLIGFGDTVEGSCP